MVGRPIQNKIGGGGQRRPTVDRSQLDQKRGEALKLLGLPDPSQANDTIAGRLDEILNGHAQKLGGQIGQIDAQKVAKDFRSQTARAAGAAFQPQTTIPSTLVVPGSGDVKVTGKSTKGAGFQLSNPKLRGSKDQPSALMSLMREAGINPNSFGPNVRAAIEDSRGKDIGHKGNWKQLSGRLASAKVLDTKLVKVGPAALGKTTQAKASTSADGVSKRELGGGLAKTATTKEGAKLEESPEMMRLREKDPALAERVAENTAKLQDVFREAGITDENTQAELGETFQKVLSSGQRDSSAAGRAWGLVQSSQRQLSGSGMPNDKPGQDTKPLVDGAAWIAASNLVGIVADKAGADFDPSAMQGVKDVLVSHARQGKSSGSGSDSSRVNLGRRKTVDSGPKNGASKRSGAKRTGGPRSRRNKPQDTVPPKVKQSAHEHLREMGIDPENEATAHTVKDVEKAFSSVLGDGKKADKDVALDGLKWLDKQTGGADADFAKQMKMILDQPPSHDDLAKQAKATGTPMPEGNMESSAKDAVMKKVALCAAAGPEAYKEHLASAAAAGPPPGFGGPGGPGGPGGVPGMEGLFDQFGVVNSTARQLMGASILMDPSLSHEDKIALFMMLIMKFMDQDRMRQMEEIAQLDSKQSALEQQKQLEGTIGEDGNPITLDPNLETETREIQTARDTMMMKMERTNQVRSSVFEALRGIIDELNKTTEKANQSMGK